MQTAFIQCQPDITGGTTVFADLRVPVRALVEYLEGGETIDDFLEGFQAVGGDKVITCFSMPQSVKRACVRADAGRIVRRIHHLRIKIGGHFFWRTNQTRKISPSWSALVTASRRVA